MWWRKMGKQERIHFVVYSLMWIFFAFADMTWTERVMFCFMLYIMNVLDNAFSEK